MRSRTGNNVLQRVTLLVFFIASVIPYTSAFAGGKPVGKKRLFLIPAAAYFFNSTYWDKNGLYHKYDDGLKFGSAILSVNSEYGFSRKISLMATVPYLINRVYQPGSATTSVSGLGDAEVGVRYYAFNIDYNFYFSVQGNLIIPLYKNTSDKSLGYQQLGTEVRLLGAGDFKFLSQKFYFEVSTGSRQYMGALAPFQLKNSLSLSYSLTKKNQLSIAGTSLYSFSAVKNSLNVVNPLDVATTKDFSFNQLTASYSYSIQRNKSLFLSFSKFITGRNTGDGSTLSIGYVYKY
ncbi:hypothetical protein [Mucilaginibacter paludis]|uniref:Uncharacterized protein n=1 Tax=Mucilaginibacter paludis DSM 18603 TaxID=714943 RepID=H1Y704_9SPHI|nr:hypothetical protein [Mucilaginibacter paludis]EHQ28411.1 hypothetical protein Mucpa_4321 [Mucilaginibacter paludis DSM 18603]